MRTPEQIIGRDALIQLIFEGYVVVSDDARQLVESAMMAYSETQPDEETRMAHMIAPISELNDLLNPT